MKKEAKVEFGIEIVKPWSKEMYAHNEALAEVVKEKVHVLWVAAYEAAEAEFVDEDDLGNEFIDMQWDEASSEMVEIQKAITYYSYSNQSIGEVAEEVGINCEQGDILGVSAGVTGEGLRMPSRRLREVVSKVE